MSKFATRYQPNRFKPLHISQASLTRQEFARECDINDIMAKYAAGITPSLPAQTPFFGDSDVIPDYQAALDLVINAQNAFYALPSRVRDRFANDPARLIEWLRDVNNRDEAIKLGLVASAAENSAAENSAAEKSAAENSAAENSAAK